MKRQLCNNALVPEEVMREGIFLILASPLLQSRIFDTQPINQIITPF